MGRGGWLYVGLHPDGALRLRAERKIYLDEPLVLLWRERQGKERIEEVWRLQAQSGRILVITDYVCCPETLSEVASHFGLGDRLHVQSYLQRL